MDKHRVNKLIESFPAVPPVQNVTPQNSPGTARSARVLNQEGTVLVTLPVIEGIDEMSD